MFEILGLAFGNISLIIVAFFIGRAYEGEILGDQIQWTEDEIEDE